MSTDAMTPTRRWAGNPTRGRLESLVFSLFLVFASQEVAEAWQTDSFCAKVKLEIQQELTLERQAFEAHMRIHNGLTHLSLENVAVTVNFADEDGTPVLVSSDPDDTSALFFIREDSLSNIAAVDGTGSVAPSTSADIHWLIIPAPGASNGVPQGTLYYVGATLSYTLGGEPEGMEVTPDYIYVKPMPALVLDYFLPTDVYGDDAFTAEIEPPIPFSLGVRVTNTGQGTARSMKIDSGQPKIVENELGLLVGFNIEGSEVNGSPATNSLLVDFGDIAPGDAGVARWLMTCSLSGQFTEFTAEYTHSDELGGKLTSLMGAPATHVLVRDVRVDVAGRDGIRDFLAREADDSLTVYESEGIDTAVSDLSASASLVETGQNGSEVTYDLTLPVAVGFAYVKLTDPFSQQKELKEVVRSDGKRIKNDNVWLSKSRNKNRTSPDYLEWEYYLHLFDADSTGSYTVVFDTPAALPNPPVLQLLADQTLAEGDTVSFIVQATDADGTIPALTAAPLPVGATFTDNGDGFGNFSWTPAEGQAGTYGITFRASAGALEDTQLVTIAVWPVWDTDGDGMADAWELEHFGDLSRDGTGDFDGDGVSDLDEFLLGTDPDTGVAPTIPVAEAPAVGSEVAVLQPDLVVRNSLDRDGDPVTYQWEVFEDAELTLPVATATNVVAGVDTTTWTVPVALADHARYHWRVRAGDGKRFSPWAYGSFFVNTANDAPGSFALSAPADATAVGTGTPTLQVTNSADRDEDALTYAFEVYEDPALTLLVASVAGVTEGAGGTTSWTVDTPLSNALPYFWQAVVTDEHGAATASAVGTFVVDPTNQAPFVPVVNAPADGSEVPTTLLTLVVDNATDADGDPLTYAFEIDTVATFDSPDKQTGTLLAEGTGATAWDVPDPLPDNSQCYWRTKASDGSAESAWTKAATVFVNTANDAPAAPALHNPSDGGEVWTVTPVLSVISPVEVDGDALTYEYEVYTDAALTDLVTFAADQGPAWTSPALGNDRTYHWRARAVDEHGLAGPWMDAAAFFVNETAYDAPPTVAITSPDVAGVLTNQNAFSIAWTDADPDSNATIALYFDDNATGYDGSRIVAGIAEDDPGNTYVWDAATLPDGTYYLYAVIADALTTESAYGDGPVTFDRVAPTTLATPAGGGFAVPQAVTLEADEPATIHYTTDGTAPDTNSPIYTAPLPIDTTTTLRFFALDAAGNEETLQTQTYTIDTEPPTGIVRIDDDAAQTNAADVTLTLSATDNSGTVSDMRLSDEGLTWTAWEPCAATRAWTLPAGDGLKSVYAEFRDALGNVSAPASDTITLDTTPPMVVITSPEPGLTNDSAPLLTYTVSDGIVTVRLDELVVAKVSGDLLGPLEDGLRRIKVEATDTAGNAGFDEVTLHVDTTPPAVTAPPDTTAEAEGPQTPVSIGMATARDSVGVISLVSDSPATFPIGETLVTWTATDTAGNQGASTQMVTVVDTTPPELSGVADLTAEANGVLSTVNLGAVSATDLVDGPVGAANNAPTDGFPLGTTAVTWTAGDAAGNTVAVAQRVTVVDTTAPMISPPASVSVYALGATTPVNIGSASATDIFPLTISHDAPAAFSVGTTTVTWTATDVNENSDTAPQTVTVWKREVHIAYTGDTECQWSDSAVFSARVSDVTPGRDPAALAHYGRVTFRLRVDGQVAHAHTVDGTDGAGSAAVTHWFLDPALPSAAAYDVVAEFADPAGVFASGSVSRSFALHPEAGEMEYTGERVVTVHEEGFYLQATLFQEEEESTGELVDFDDEDNPVWVQFRLYRFHQDPSTDAPHFSPEPVRLRNSLLHPSVGVNGVFIPLASLGAESENYVVTMELVDDRYIHAEALEPTVTVYDPDGRFFTGGGHVTDPLTGEPTNFGFTFKFSKQGKAQGNLVHILRDREAGTKTRIKSNMLEAAGFPPGEPPGVSTAAAEGRCNVSVYDLETGEQLSGEGNLRFHLTVEDLGETGVEEDTFRLEIRHPDGVPYEPGHMYEREYLQGGNIVIHDR